MATLPIALKARESHVGCLAAVAKARGYLDEVTTVIQYTETETLDLFVEGMS